MLEEVFNCLLELSSLFQISLFNRSLTLLSLFPAKLMVELDCSETEYQSCVTYARKTIHFDTKSTNRICHLPRELLELILLKSVVWIMFVEWPKNVLGNKLESGSYNLYETVSNKTFMSASISLQSVTYQWIHNRCLKKGVVLKQFFLRRLQGYYAIFAEQLNCRYVFVDCLEREGILTKEEKIHIMETDGDTSARQYEDIPESCWPLLRESQQMITSNKKLIRCFVGKNYFQILRFLKLLEDCCLTHILNYFISSGNFQLFGDIWPLTNARRINVMKCGTSIVTNMNILELIEKKKSRNLKRWMAEELQERGRCP